jgi:hypothetical protein
VLTRGLEAERSGARSSCDAQQRRIAECLEKPDAASVVDAWPARGGIPASLGHCFEVGGSNAQRSGKDKASTELACSDANATANHDTDLTEVIVNSSTHRLCCSANCVRLIAAAAGAIRVLPQRAPVSHLDRTDTEADEPSRICEVDRVILGIRIGFAGDRRQRVPSEESRPR